VVTCDGTERLDSRAVVLASCCGARWGIKKWEQPYIYRLSAVQSLLGRDMAEEGDMRDSENDGFRNRTSSDKWILTFARDNLALSVPIIGALIFAFRCVLVSAGDPHVAFIIATQTSVGDAIRALLFTVIPALLLLLSIVIALTVGTRIHYVNHHNFFKILGMGLVSVALSLGYGFLTGSFQEEPLIGA
jgi:hypothetical protein